MCAVITAKDGSERELSQVEIDQELAWSELGEILGYPQSWISIPRERLLADGKLWRWQVLSELSVPNPANRQLAPGH